MAMSHSELPTPPISILSSAGFQLLSLVVFGSILWSLLSFITSKVSFFPLRCVLGVLHQNMLVLFGGGLSLFHANSGTINESEKKKSFFFCYFKQLNNSQDEKWYKLIKLTKRQSCVSICGLPASTLPI